jgi:hypothetical protein
MLTNAAKLGITVCSRAAFLSSFSSSAANAGEAPTPALILYWKLELDIDCVNGDNVGKAGPVVGTGAGVP